MPIYLPIRRPLYTKPTLGSQIAEENPLSNGLVGAYLMNENSGTLINDLVNGSNGTVSATTWTVGQFGSCLNFNGTSSLVTIGKVSSLNLSGAMTISAWINFSSNNTLYIAADWSTSSNAAEQWGFSITGNQGRLVWAQAGSAIIGSNTLVVSQNKWFHVVATRSSGASNSTVIYYVNSIKQGTANNSSAPAAQSGALIGGGAAAISTLYKGEIDNVGFWNRALSPAEISQLYIDPFCHIKQFHQGILKQKKQTIITTNNAIWFGAIA